MRSYYLQYSKNLPTNIYNQIQEIAENGFCMVELAGGSQRKVTKEDILIKKEDVDKLIAMQKKEVSHENTPKIIQTSNGLLQGK